MKSNRKVSYSAVMCIALTDIPLADEPQVDDEENVDGSGGHARLHHMHKEQDEDNAEIWDDFYRRVISRSRNRERRDTEHGDDTDNILWELGCLVCDPSFTKMNFNLNYSSQDMKKSLCAKFGRKYVTVSCMPTLSSQDAFLPKLLALKLRDTWQKQSQSSSGGCARFGIAI